MKEGERGGGREGRETEEDREADYWKQCSRGLSRTFGFDRVELSHTSTVDAPRRRKYRNLLIA